MRMLKTSEKPLVENIPDELKQLSQWVTWDYGRGTKLPKQTSGEMAASNDPSTWTTFDNVKDFPRIAFMFSEDDPYCGIDLDGCRNPLTGAIAPWAMCIIDEVSSYTEVSPSGTGVKIICEAKNPFPTGKNLKIDVERIKGVDKEPGVEMYDHVRFWTMTGDVLGNDYRDINEAQDGNDWFVSEYWPAKPTTPTMPTTFNGNTSGLVERATKYVATMPSAVAGQNGHDQTYSVACVLVDRFGLSSSEAWQVLCEYNQGCQPPWSEKELQHKLDDAIRNNPSPSRDLANGQRQAPDHFEHGESKPTAEPVDYEFYSLCELTRGDFPVDYLIDRVLARGFNAMMHGPSKSFKTMVALDMALSLCSGRPFLGYYRIERVCNVLYWSGENAKAESAERLKRIVAAKGINDRAIDKRFHLSCDLPQIAHLEHIDAIIRKIEEYEANVVFVDPTYLAMDTQGREASLFAMGQQLRPLAKECAERGVTFILVHHDTQSRSRNNYDVPEFTNMSFAGFEQFARQWISLGRRAPYEPESGCASIWLHAGGSMGHNSCIGLDITEGQRDDDGGRTWEIDVIPYQDAIKTLTNAKQVKEETTRKAKTNEMLSKMNDIVRELKGEWISRSKLAERLGTKTTRSAFTVAFAELLQSASVEEKEDKAANGVQTTFVRWINANNEGHPHTTDTLIT